LSDDLAVRLADRFTIFREQEAFVFPGAHDAIDALRARGVKLALVTNGGADTQRAKVERFALTHRFDHIQIEGEHGFGKPEERAYLHAMQALGVTATETWMVGDNLEWEVEAPQRLGIYAIWIDVHGDGLPEGSTIKPDRIIRSLTELVPPEQGRSVQRNAEEIITTPPVITATSRIAA
jgi:putative hydrolase of the HAD superfamily